MTEDEHTGHEPALGGGDNLGGSEPWLGGAHGIQLWLDALNSGDNRAIWRGAQGLASHGAASIPRLVEALSDPDHRVRAVAAWGLARLARHDAAREAAGTLAVLLQDDVLSVRVLGANALGQIIESYPDVAENVKAALREYRSRRP